MYSNVFLSNSCFKNNGYNPEDIEGALKGEESFYAKPQDIELLREKNLLPFFEGRLILHIIDEQDLKTFKQELRKYKGKISKVHISKELLLSKGIPTDLMYDIEINNINDLSIEQLMYLKENGRKLNYINLRGFNFPYQFRVDDLLLIKQKISDITKYIRQDGSDIKKFLKVYEILGKNLSYKQSADYRKAILNKEAACHGYSDLLNFTLNYIGIESIAVNGDTYVNNNRESHRWNQVKIDGKWYNCDLTWDSLDMKKGKKINYCLRDDESFYKNKEHVYWPSEENNIHKVHGEYNQEIIQQYFLKDIDRER